MSGPFRVVVALDGFAVARNSYRPQSTRFVLVAESPPCLSSRRFFYFEDVTAAEPLFLTTMRVLYTDAADARATPASALRARKGQLLPAFQSDGFCLVDACEKPMPRDASPSVRKRLLREALPGLAERLAILGGLQTPLFLIAAMVYEATCHYLKAVAFNVANTESIDFPSNGHARQFREKLSSAVKRAGWYPKSSGALDDSARFA
jgi:hypothetical protein